MTNFGWWADRLASERPGYFLCMICFEGKPISEAHVDEYGDAWDSCKACEALEQEALRRRTEGT